MQFRQKLGYMALGGVLVLAGHVLPGLMVGSATAQGGLQDAEFRTVRAQNLIVGDPISGYITLMADEDGVGLVGRDASGAFSFTMVAASDEATISIVDKSRGTGILLQDTAEAMPILAAGYGEAALAYLSLDENGGNIGVKDKYGEPEAGFAVNVSGDGYVFP